MGTCSSSCSPAGRSLQQSVSVRLWQVTEVVLKELRERRQIQLRSTVSEGLFGAATQQVDCDGYLVRKLFLKKQLVKVTLQQNNVPRGLW